MKKLLFLILAISGLNACIPSPIDIDVQPAPPSLCVASQVIGNSGIIIGLTRSYSPLQGSVEGDTTGNLLDEILVENAIVTISYGAQTDTLSMVAPGIYSNLLIPIIEGETYVLRAKDPAKGLEVWASTVMQKRVTFDALNPVIYRTAADTQVYFRYTLHDNLSEENYYVVNFVKKVQGNAAFDINSIFAAGSNEVLTEFELYDDQAFNNGVLNKDVRVMSVHHTDTVAVVVSGITKGYYEFLTAFKRSSSVFNQLTGEPINYPTNIEDGHGYFTMHRMETTIYDLNQY
ncbi:MAG: hypothetical protein Fur0041_16670 [Bacteroidia bacterium]